jgi:primosomal protein N'
MSKSSGNNTELWLSYLVWDSPAWKTVKNILRWSKTDLLLAIRESISNKWKKNFSRDNPDLVDGALKISKDIILSDKFTNDLVINEAIFLTLSFSNGKSLIDNLKFIALNNNISSNTRIETINTRMTRYSDDKKLFFLLELYWTKNISWDFERKLKENILNNINKWNRSIDKKLFLLLKLYKNKQFSWLSSIIKDLIVEELKNKKHSISNISKVLTNIWSDLYISSKIDIFLLRWIKNFPWLSWKLKSEINMLLNPDWPKDHGENIYKDWFVEMIFYFDDNSLIWSLILAFYKKFGYRNDTDKLLNYFKKNDNKKFWINILNLFVNNWVNIDIKFWKVFISCFSCIQAKDLIVFIDHDDIKIQRIILALINNLNKLDWNKNEIKNPIRKKIKSKDPYVRWFAVDILEKNEHQKALLPVLSIINRANRSEIDNLDLSILDQVCNSHLINFDKDLFKESSNRFPFVLTPDQINCSMEIIKDMWWDERMYRLLQWDVGSWKTEVLLMSMQHVINSSKQCVFLCPTQILASQQFQKCRNFFPPNIEVALLTNNTSKKEKERILRNLEEWKIHVLVWTHSILDKDINFKDLALAVIDEQQKFGVIQRSNILRQNCHALEITATPIPRSLSLRNIWLIDVSSIKQLPEWRKNPETVLINSEARENLMKDIKEKISEWKQIYRVCKSINSSNYKSVYDVYDELNKQFSEYKIWIMHWNQTSKNNQNVLNDFMNWNINILVSTTMVESWLDIANAKVIVVENAESYWLSQLHQMRWRVSRDNRQWYCYLCTDVMRFDTVRKESLWGRDVSYSIKDNITWKIIYSSREKNITIKNQQEKIDTILECFDWYEIAERDLRLSGWWEIKWIKQRWRY